MGWFFGRTPTAELNFELYFVTEVLGLRSLHYGYWDEGRASQRIDLDEVARAQARFTERLLAFVPPDTKSVLDVGAGVGDNARAFAGRGHVVTAISPDHNHAAYFERNPSENVRFQRSTFEAFEAPDAEARFDLILFSESHRYFDRRLGLEKARRLLRPGGALLLSGMFPADNKVSFPEGFGLEDLAYVELARELGFALEDCADITENVFPTVEIVDQAVEEFLEPGLRFGRAYLEARSPWKAWLARRFLAGEDADLSRALRKLRRKMDPARFRDRFRYATLLLRVE